MKPYDGYFDWFTSRFFDWLFAHTDGDTQSLVGVMSPVLGVLVYPLAVLFALLLVGTHLFFIVTLIRHPVVSATWASLRRASSIDLQAITGVQTLTFALAVAGLVAVIYGTTQMLRFDLKPDDYFKDKKSLELAKAILTEDLTKIDALKQGGVNLNALHEKDATLLTWAMVNRRQRTFIHLLKIGADPNLTDGYGTQPLAQAAAWFTDTTYLDLLLANGASVNSRESNDSYATFAAYDAGPGRWGNVVYLLDHGADINAKHGAETLMDVCGLRNDFYHALYLLNRGANWRLYNPTGIAYDVQENDSSFPEIIEQQAIMKQALVRAGVRFLIERLYEAKFKSLRRQWYSTDQIGREWEQKLLRIANDPYGFGRAWITAKEAETVAFDTWVKANDLTLSEEYPTDEPNFVDPE